MAKSLSALSYFNPASKHHHCLDDFKKVQKPQQKAVIITLTILAAIVSLPIAGFGGVAVFRRLTELYLKDAEKIVSIAKKTLPEPIKAEEPRCSLRLQEKRNKELPSEQIIPAIKDAECPNSPVKPDGVVETPKTCTKSRKKGYIVSIIGSERVKYWCPKATAVTGLVLGFYSSNLALNFGLYFLTSQTAKSAILSDGAAKLAPYVGKIIPSSIASSIPAQGALSIEDSTLLAEMQAQLSHGIEITKQNYEVLENVATNLGKASSAASEATIFSADGARVASQFAQTASHGDVPLNFLSPTNGIAAITAACGGYILGQYLADWLDSESHV